MFSPLLFVMIPAFLLSIAGSARAECTVEWKYSRGKTFRTTKCDESQTELDEAKAAAAAPCMDLERELADACYDAVAASFELRREAMLRRTLREGATVEAAAERYGYTEEEVAQWIEANESHLDSYYEESDEASPEHLRADRELAELITTLGLTP
jgi:hypothetical protein